MIRSNFPPEWLDRYQGRYDQGYDVTRAARIERMKALGILDPEATVFPRLPNVPAWNDLPATKSASRHAGWNSMPPWSRTWTPTSAS